MNSTTIARLANPALLEGLQAALKDSRGALVSLLLYLAEIEERRLHLAGGFTSMFAYLIGLGFSEGESWKRLTVARAGRAYPMLLELIAEGKLHLTGAALLSGKLTQANHAELLTRAQGKTKHDIQVLLATLAPQPNTPGQVRRLPERPQQKAPVGPPLPTPTAAQIETATPGVAPSPPSCTPARAGCSPTKRSVDSSRRALPRALERTVYLRDQGKCAFRGTEGRVCGSKVGLEFHHHDPHRRGGADEVSNISLRCARHNKFQAELDFGRAHQERFGRQHRGASDGSPGSPVR